MKTSRQNPPKNLTLKCVMIEVCITTTGIMYEKQELVITFTTGPSFMFKKVVHDGTLIEEQEIILAKKENKN